MTLIETRNVPTWQGTEAQQTQSCGATSNTTLTAIPAGAVRVVFSILMAVDTDFLAIHNNASASAVEGVMVGGSESFNQEFILNSDSLPTFYAYNPTGGTIILGAMYFF